MKNTRLLPTLFALGSLSACAPSDFVAPYNPYYAPRPAFGFWLPRAHTYHTAPHRPTISPRPRAPIKSNHR